MWMMYVESRYSALYVSSTLTMVKAGGKQRTVVAVACLFNCHEDRVADALWRPVYCSRVCARDTKPLPVSFCSAVATDVCVGLWFDAAKSSWRWVLKFYLVVRSRTIDLFVSAKHVHHSVLNSTSIAIRRRRCTRRCA